MEDELHPKFGNLYRSKGINDLSLPQRIMKFVVDNSKKICSGQGVIALQCPALWDMTEKEFKLCFGGENET